MAAGNIPLPKNHCAQNWFSEFVLPEYQMPLHYKGAETPVGEIARLRATFGDGFSWSGLVENPEVQLLALLVHQEVRDVVVLPDRVQASNPCTDQSLKHQTSPGTCALQGLSCNASANENMFM